MRMLYLVAGLAALTLALAALVRVFEPSFAFFPARGEDVTPLAFGVPFDASDVATADGERLRMWTLTATPSRALVVYFHGNGGNLSVWASILSGIARRGFTVIAFDYRGYGLSTGKPSEPGLYRDVDAVLARVWAGDHGQQPVIYWGRSLGTTMAAYAATRRAPSGLVLEAGFPDARSLTRSSPPLALLGLFSSYRFPTAAYIRQVTVPTLVMHGDVDTIIPYGLGRALFEAVRGPKQFVTIRGGDHNDATPADQTTYWNAVETFVEGLRK